MLTALLVLSVPALAAPSAAAIHKALAKPEGWSTPQTSKGVAVSQKTIPGVGAPAFRAVRTVDVSCDAYFANVADPNRHKAVNSMLLESKVISTSGNDVIFYQIVELPLISDRYWINVATNERNIDGVAGHHRQTWSVLNKDDYPTQRDRAEGTFDAVFTTLNFGSWDLQPAGDNSCTITYTAISDPGGSVPSGAASWASEKSLPDNINAFYQAAKK